MTDIESTQSVTATDPALPEVPLVDLDDITPDESLLLAVRKTRITTPATRVLLALVVLGATFLGGALVERWQHKTSSSASASSLFAQFRAARGGAGGSGGSGAAGGSGSGAAAAFPGGGGATFGTVKLVDGTNVYVQDAQGDTIKITTKPTTTVSVTKSGTVGELAPGSTVIVQGTASSDGLTMAATSISQSTGGFGAGRFRGTAG